VSAHAEAEPTWTPPPLACDAHFHVFGAQSRYPVLPETRYDPPSAPLSDYLALSERLGISRYVFVQPSAYGRDNSSMLDAMRESAPRAAGASSTSMRTFRTLNSTGSTHSVSAAYGSTSRRFTHRKRALPPP
jgi:predicted TIM-barrel fold metal-dependent hydrolase